MPGAHPAAARAEHLLQLGRPDAAIALLGPALTKQPDDAGLLTCAAYAYLLKNDWVQAAELGRRASAADPHHDRPLRIQASALLRLGQVTDATALEHRAVQMAPHVYNSHLLYAQCLSRIPRFHEHAMAEARRSVELAPNEPSAHIGLAQVAYPPEKIISPHRLDVAEQALQRALTLDPQNSIAMNELARVRLRRSKRFGAMTGFSDALTADPQNQTALRNTAVVLGGFLKLAHWMILAAILVSLAGLDPDAGVGGWIVQGVVAVGVLGVVIWFVVRVRMALPRRFRVFLREFARHDGWAVAWAGCLAVAVLLLVSAPLLPEGARGYADGCALVIVTGGVFCRAMWIASRRLR